MALNDDAPRLGCGRNLDDLWGTIDEPPTTHELGCSDCQHARSALFNLAAVTEAMKERDLTDPGLQPAGRIKEAIMMVARAEIRRSRRTVLRETPHGSIDISEQALNSLIRFAASTVPGVHARRCTITTTEGKPSGTDTVDLSDVRMSLHVALSSSVSIPPTMAVLRERIGTIVHAQTAISMQQIDVVVEDLYDL
ncbi:Asp23/Gls24 family envelope stress response protein [Arthrobacter sp. Br18]|uniref:Asp23/Gls24 family envelope stress response protein n=1 Tax=Arthrobacter sp. Br18 TaxID=1312954 RepID=UPI0004BC419F|nr:Asp23/Gls24 family envelope stress response protein [Arthrobacter sp. Br18]